MKIATISIKNNITGLIENEGEAILLNCMDRQENRSFYEIRFLNDMNITHCRWVENSRIIEEPEEMEN